MRQRVLCGVGPMIAALACGFTAAAQAGEIRRTEHSVPRSAGAPASAVEYEFDSRRMRLRVLPTVALKPNANSASTSGISVREAATLPSVRALMRSEMLLVNGGFSSSSTQRSAGLLISDGRAVSLPEFGVRRGDPANACAALRAERLRLSALLCVDAAGSVQVGPMSNADLDRCQQALQAGPLLLRKDGKADMCPAPAAEREYLRTVLCTRDTLVKVIVVLQPVSLYDLAQWLAKPPSAQGPGCTAAMNLSGDTSTGAVYSAGGKQSAARGPDFAAAGSFPQASLLLISPR